MNLGDVIAGRFRLDARAGAGGMGTVFRATDVTTGGTVALKVIEARALGAERFAREAKLLSELRYPGIVRYLHHGVLPNGEFFLAMEWVTGKPLSARLDGEGLSTAEAVGVALRVAEAVAVAHAAGVVHRDLKPDNIMMLDGDTEQVKVIDLGIARRLRDAHTLTRTGTMVGSPGYVAPEQARGDVDLDQCVDVFALGCVLYEMLTGQAAYAGQSLMARLAKVLLGQPPQVGDRCPEAPQGLRDLVTSMLAFDPNGRPRDCGEVAAALAALPAIAQGPRRRRLVADEMPTREVIDAGARAAAPTAEQPVVCLVMVASEEDDEVGSMPTMSGDAIATSIEQLRQALTPFAARLEVLADGSMMIVLRGALPEIGDVAVECARVVRDQMAPMQVALTIERRQSDTTGLDPMSIAIERGAATLTVGSLQALFTPSADGWVPEDAIRLDAVTAKLLEGRAEILHTANAFYLKA